MLTLLWTAVMATGAPPAIADPASSTPSSAVSLLWLAK